MHKIVLATEQEIPRLSEFSVKVGNIPFFKDQVIASMMIQDKEILGFAAVQSAWLAAGSWIKEDLRKNGYASEVRKVLDDELRRRNIPIYLSLPTTEFERNLFAKYGHVTERLAQIRYL